MVKVLVSYHLSQAGGYFFSWQPIIGKSNKHLRYAHHKKGNAHQTTKLPGSWPRKRSVHVKHLGGKLSTSATDFVVGVEGIMGGGKQCELGESWKASWRRGGD